MKIEFTWKRGCLTDPSAESLAGKVSTKFSGLRIWPGQGYRKEWETLILETPGLSDPYVFATIGGDGRIHETDYCAVVATIEEVLIGSGVKAEVLVNDGFSLRQYSAQQEKLARRRKKAMEEAIALLKKTRKLFGKKVFETVRRRLEQDLADPVY